MAIYTQVNMKIDHFHDFYYLQALKAASTQALVENGDLEFSKAFEKFQDNLKETEEELVPNIALRTFVYLYAACLGEARHARENIAADYFIPMSIGKNRHEVFASAINYRPTKENIKVIVDAFAQKWKAGFGGSAWKRIADALYGYFTDPPSAFIDHVIDLEHNNGTVFNKRDAKDTIFFTVKYGNGRFSDFLDYKFKKDILSVPFQIVNGCSCDSCAPNQEILHLSPKVYKLVSTFCTIVKKDIPAWLTPGLENLDEYHVEWGDRKLTLEKKWQEYANVTRTNRPNAKDIFNKSHLYDMYVHDMNREQVKKAYRKFISRNKTSPLSEKQKALLEKQAKDWLKNSLMYCKKSKAKVTYAILPCTAHLGASHRVVLNFPVPFEKVGTPTEKGFTFKCTNNGIWFEGRQHGHVYLNGTHVMLWVEGSSISFYLPSNCPLEALLR